LAGAARQGAALGTLGTLVRHAYTEGSLPQACAMLMEVSRFQPSFGSAAELGGAERYAVRLAARRPDGAGTVDGGADRDGKRLKIVCVPSFVVGSGPHQFMRFAAHLDGRRDVFVLTLPGFRGGDPVPASWEVATEVLEQAVRHAVGDDPFVLVGYSIGGVLAHSLAARFEAAGAAPVPVIMIDTPTPDDVEHNQRVFTMVMTEILRNENEAIAVDDANWLSMGAYIRLLNERSPARITSRSLLIRAGELLGDSGQTWPAWEVGDDEVEVGGDHFALIEAAAGDTADAVERWIEA
jgi:thioesterase domain-containing protein